MGPLTDQGKADWAAVAAPLSISEGDARLAFDALLEDPGVSPPCK